MKQFTLWRSLGILLALHAGCEYDRAALDPASEKRPHSTRKPSSTDGTGLPVAAPRVAIARFHAASYSVDYRMGTTLRWRVLFADGCMLHSNPPIGPPDVDGQRLAEEDLPEGNLRVTPEVSTTFTLACHGPGSPVSASVHLRVGPPPPTIHGFGFAASTINYGEEAGLTWSAVHAEDCHLTGTPHPLSAMGEVTFPAYMPESFELTCRGPGGETSAAARLAVRAPVINEVAWMGTLQSATDEWIELYNRSETDITLDGWALYAEDGTPFIQLAGVFPAGGYRLFERTDDTTVPEQAADQIYTGGLVNSGEILYLRDALGNRIDLTGSGGSWPAGNNATKATMERAEAAVPGDTPGAWEDATLPYSGGFGTPRAMNSGPANPYGGTTDDHHTVYFSEHTTSVMPGFGPRSMANALVAAIDATQQSIAFAFDDFASKPEIVAALERAVQRGVAVRGVVDSDGKGRYAFSGTADLIAGLPAGSVVADMDDRLMHHKFVVFDGSSVWTGSANPIETDLGAEYNCNVVLHIQSTALARAYEAEFNEMFAGRFHLAKRRGKPIVIPRLPDGTRVKAYFSPTDDTRNEAILPLIDQAAASIDLSIFYFTDMTLANALIAAHDRGVAVRVILDATGAADPHSVHAMLRAAGLAVKVENWAGKGHMKAMRVDGHRTLLGSQNWTQAGNAANDENTLVIDNEILAAAMGAHFDADWQSIPEQWRLGDPRAESTDSPGSLSDLIDNDHDGLTDEGAPQFLGTLSDAPGAINLYFNKGTLPRYALPGNQANAHVDFQERFLIRLRAATESVDVTAYEIDLPDVVDALIDKAAEGVRVRLIADGKAPPPEDTYGSARYAVMRIHLERLRRGRDGIAGTGDDVAVLGDAPIFAVEDPALRTLWGLPPSPADFPFLTTLVGHTLREGHLVAHGELKSTGGYYAAGDQMHNKFSIFDRKWVWTGSWNLTLTSYYGADEHQAAGIRAGNTDQVVELHSTELAAVYAGEFDAMWGGHGAEPDAAAARFRRRKSSPPRHRVTVGDREVYVLFSPGANAVDELVELVRDHAHTSVDFAVFAWSHQPLADMLKHKWEGSVSDQTGRPTGFAVRGVFARSYWDRWWSASVDMRGLTMEGTVNNPNTRWASPPPVFADGEDRKLHTKLMVLDAGSPGATVVLGSTNWAENGNSINDENMLVIRDPGLANQVSQFLWARYFQAGGSLR